MTQRSTKPYQPKTTTISRRLRDRAEQNQNLSVQPPEIPLIRGARSRRAATLPTPRHNPIDYQTPGSHPPSLAWNTSHILEGIRPSYSSQPTSSELRLFRDLVPSQTTHFPPHESPQGSESEFVSTINHQSSHSHHIPASQTIEFLPSPLPSTSSSHAFEFQSQAGFEQPNDSFIELQDMRYETPPTVSEHILM